MSDTSASGVASLCGSLLGLTLLTVILRLHARSKQQAPFGVDDWLVVAAWIVFVGLTADMFSGISQHVVSPQPSPNTGTVEAHSHIKAIATIDVLSILSMLSLGLVKLSALFFYRRVFNTGNRDIFGIMTGVFIAIVTIYTLVFFVTCLTLCIVNIYGDWRKCSEIGLLQAMIYIDVMFEFLVLILPIPKVWTLHLSTQKRVAVSGVFLLATVGFISSCVRLAFFLQLYNVQGDNTNRANPSWEFFTVLEAGLTIIAVNLPLIWYYVHVFGPKLNSSLRSVRFNLPFFPFKNKTARLSSVSTSGDMWESGQASFSQHSRNAARNSKLSTAC